MTLLLDTSLLPVRDRADAVQVAGDTAARTLHFQVNGSASNADLQLSNGSAVALELRSPASSCQTPRRASRAAPQDSSTQGKIFFNQMQTLLQLTQPVRPNGEAVAG